MNMREEKKFLNSWFRWGIFWLIILTILGTGASYLGLFGRTVVERKVFENSFQYSETQKTRIASYEAQLAEINHQLNDTTLTDSERKNLKTTAAGLRVQLNTAKGMQ